jgi:hypothetical protein
MRYHEFASLKENASSGSSSSSSVATLNTPFFSSDPKETEARSIYGAQPSNIYGKKKKTNKVSVIKR